MDQERIGGDGFAFEGNWRDYAPIAFTNLLLTIVTLGIYRFWATTRTRRYLWANTRFIDDRLEWTGTGRSEEHTSELQSLMRISYAVFCLKKKKTNEQSYRTQ